MGLILVILPICGHEGSFYLSPVHALTIFLIAMQVEHSYNSSTNGRILLTHAFRYGLLAINRIKILLLTRIEFTTSALAGVQVTYYNSIIDHSGDEGILNRCDLQ